MSDLLAAPAVFGFFGGDWILHGIAKSLGYRDGFLWGRFVDEVPIFGEICDLVRLARESGSILNGYTFWLAFTVVSLLVAILALRLDLVGDRLAGPRS